MQSIRELLFSVGNGEILWLRAFKKQRPVIADQPLAQYPPEMETVAMVTPTVGQNRIMHAGWGGRANWVIHPTTECANLYDSRGHSSQWIPVRSLLRPLDAYFHRTSEGRGAHRGLLDLGSVSDEDGALPPEAGGQDS